MEADYEAPAVEVAKGHYRGQEFGLPLGRPRVNPTFDLYVARFRRSRDKP